jgi:hypothetical protein
MADRLNKFFNQCEPVQDVDQMEYGTRLDHSKITKRRIKEKIKNLRPNSAAAPDRIGANLPQSIQEEAAPALRIIYQRSMDERVLPEDWRRANVTPIFKKGAKFATGNYRPVSLTSVCCKIQESIIRDILMDHLLKKDLLHQSKHSFMACKPCTTNLLEFLGLLTSAVDAGNSVDVIFFLFCESFRQGTT